MGRLWGPIHHNVNFPFSAKASSPSSDPLNRELSVWIGIIREIWGVPSHKVGGTPGVGSGWSGFDGGPGRFVWRILPLVCSCI